MHYRAKSYFKHSLFTPFVINCRELSDTEGESDILYCGGSHSDIYQARTEGGGSIYFMVPGHKTVGKVKRG